MEGKVQSQEELGRLSIGDRLREGRDAHDAVVQIVDNCHSALTAMLRSEELPAWIKISVESRLLTKDIEIAGDCGPIDGYSSSRG